MILNVHLNNKPTDYGLERCNVAVIVELKHDEFITLNCRPLDYYDFITDNKDKLQYDNNAVIELLQSRGRRVAHGVDQSHGKII